MTNNWLNRFRFIEIEYQKVYKYMYNSDLYGIEIRG